MNQRALLAFALAAWLIACQPAATPQPILSTPTPIPPTPPPTLTPTSAPVEALAGSVDELLGVWWFPQGPIFVEIKTDGTYTVWDNYSGTQAEGDYTFEAGVITWVTSSPACQSQPAAYEAYLTRVDGKIATLRLQAVGSDPCSVRADNVKGIAKPYNP